MKRIRQEGFREEKRSNLKKAKKVRDTSASNDSDGSAHFNHSEFGITTDTESDA